MKRAFSLLLASMMLLACAACSNGSGETTASPTAAATPAANTDPATTPEATEPGSEPEAEPVELIVFAAASMTETLTQIQGHIKKLRRM